MHDCQDRCVSRRRRRRAELMAAATPGARERHALHAFELRRRPSPVRRRRRHAAPGIRFPPSTRAATATPTRSSSPRRTSPRSTASRPTSTSPGVSRACISAPAATLVVAARSGLGERDRDRPRLRVRGARRGRVVVVGESRDWRAAVEARAAALGRARGRAAHARRVARRLVSPTRRASTSSSPRRTWSPRWPTPPRHLAGSRASVAHAWLPERRARRVRARRVSDRTESPGFGVVDPTGDAADRLADARRGPEARAPRRGRSSARSAQSRAATVVAHDTPLVHRRGDRPAAAGAHRRRALRRGRGVTAVTRMLGSDAILRCARGRRRRRRLRHPRRRDPPHLRRDRARHDRAARARPARAGRGPHGGGLRARVGQGRRRDRDLRARRDEPRDADRRRVDGLDAARLHHRPGALEPDRHGRLPGDRRDRHHDADRQALLARAGRRGAPAA